MEYVVCVILFLLGLLFLVKGADVFVDSALFFARWCGISELVIGATIVSIGTTLPEAVVSATAALQGHSDIAYGNAIGSIICNTGLIVGLVLLLRPPEVERGAFLRGCAFFFSAAALYIGAALYFGGIPRIAAVLLLALFVGYMAVTMRSEAKQAPAACRKQERAQGKPLAHLFRIGVSAIAVYFGSRLMVGTAELFAGWVHVPHKVVGLTIVALGTSLPELVTAILSIRKGHGALSVGNVLGANFFNLALVSGTSSMILPTVVDAYAVRTDLIMMLLLMLLFTVPLLARARASRWQGAGLCAIYLLYVFALYHN